MKREICVPEVPASRMVLTIITNEQLEAFTDILMIKDSAHGGTKPRRTNSGPRYLGGLSDHLPIIVKF